MSDWNEVTLGSLCHGIYDGPHATPKRLDQGPIFLGISSLNAGRIDLTKSDHLSEEDFKKWTRRITPQEDDIVFSYETRLGEAALIPAGLRCCLGRRMALIRPDISKVNPKFLLYAYLSPEFQSIIRSRQVHGSTVNRISLSELPSYPILIPSLETQNQIASTLSNLDRKIENLRRQNETLEAIAQTLFKHWFVDFEFPNADGKPYKSSGGAMEPSELGEIPAGWQASPLGNHIEIQHGYSFKSEDFTEDGDPIVRMGNFLNNGGLDFKKDKTRFFQGEVNEKFWLKSNDLVVAMSDVTQNGLILGNPGLIPSDGRQYLLNQRVGKVEITGEVNRQFLYCLMKTRMYKSWLKSSANSTTVLNTSPSRIGEFLIALPSETTLLNNFRDSLEPLFRKKENNTSNVETLTQTRDVLLPKLMSGKLRIQS